MRSAAYFICLTIAFTQISAQADSTSSSQSNQKEDKSTLEQAAEYIPTGCSVPNLQIMGVNNENLKNFNKNLSTFDLTAQLNFKAITGGQRPHIDAIETCGTLTAPISDMAVQIGMYDYKTNKIYERINYSLFGDTKVKPEKKEPVQASGGFFGFGGGSTTASAEPTNSKVCQTIVIDDDDEIVYGTISSFEDKITKLAFTTQKNKILVLGFDIQGSKSAIFRFNTDAYMMTGFYGTVSSKQDDEQYLSQLGFILWLEECVSPVYVMYAAGVIALTVLMAILVCICKCCCRTREKTQTQVVYLSDQEKDNQDTGRNIKLDDIELQKRTGSPVDEKYNDVEVTDV